MPAIKDAAIPVDKAPLPCTVRVIDVWSKDAVPVQTGTKEEVADAAWLVEVGASKRWMSADDIFKQNDWAQTDERADQKVVGSATKVGLGWRAGVVICGPIKVNQGQIDKWTAAGWLQSEK